jgi:hypothetical protein
MLQKLIRFAGLLAIVGAVVLLSPGKSEAWYYYSPIFSNGYPTTPGYTYPSYSYNQPSYYQSGYYQTYQTYTTPYYTLIGGPPRYTYPGYYPGAYTGYVPYYSR